MKFVRVQMLAQEGELAKGQSYNVNIDLADRLIIDGKAIEIDIKPAAPSQTKPAAPSEIKAKKKLKRGQTVKES